MKKRILPILAVVTAAVAVVVVLLFPEKNVQSEGATSETLEIDYDNDEIKENDKDFLITESELSSEKVSFIRPIEGSKIELITKIGEDGDIKIILGTCQSCNGAPGAYYTLKGDQLQCNNCGLTFPLNVLDSPGGGCHPITPDESVYTRTDEGVLIHTDQLLAYEDLFSRVAEH